MSHAARSNTPTVAIFILDGEVYLYAETLRYLAWKLADEGARVIRFGCTGELSACTSLNSTNKADLAKFGKEPVCSRCKAAQHTINADAIFEVDAPDLLVSADEGLFLSEMRDQLQKSKQVASIMEMTFDSIEVVRIAFFDFAIQTKLSDLSILDEATMKRFVASVKDQLALLRALKRFHAQEKITHVLYTNGNYSQNTLVRIFFEESGIHCVSIEPQPTSQHILNKVSLVKDRLILDPEGLLAVSSISADAPSTPREVKEILQTFGARIDGKDFNAYTSLQQDTETNAELGKLNAFIDRFTRIHAFFLSSEDELVPHVQTHRALNNGNLYSPGDFRSQEEFARYLLHTAKQHPEVGFVVRLHPRMAANKRDHFESEEHRKYKKLLDEIDIPENVFVIYGDSKISSYYVISKADLVIISWSTIGLETLLLGKPVISIFPTCLMYPLAAFSRQPQNKADLESAIFSATEYGYFDDDFLVQWVTSAFEGQFFATATPRNSTNLLGKIYHVCYHFFARHGMYNLIASLVSRWPSARVRHDDTTLLIRKPKRAKNAERDLEAARKSLLEYRANHLQQLAIYGHGMQKNIN